MYIKLIRSIFQLSRHEMFTLCVCVYLPVCVCVRARVCVCSTLYKTEIHAVARRITDEVTKRQLLKSQT
jgi:hypothetical protein